MSTSISSCINYYLVDLWQEHGDPATAHYPLMSNFAYPLSIQATYLLLVLYVLPRFMARREKPFHLKWILVPYNLSLAFFNAYIFYKVLRRNNWGRTFAEVDFSFQHPDQTENLDWIYFYFLSKYVDMLDTIFFILRKKQSQVTGLHVYHHSNVPTFGWIYLRIKREHVISNFFSFVNSLIHTIMYSYYGLAAFGPQMQPYLWWKRYITQLQLVQFVVIISHGLYFAFYNRGYWTFFTVDVLLQPTLYLVLFTRFYLKTYKKKEA